jgi:small ligand-binding sensory domain FIST
MKQSQDRNTWLERLNPMRRTPQAARPAAAYPVAPSRANRKALTTWQDEAALKQLRQLAAELGMSQQALIAEGINYVLQKHAKSAVAT